MARGFYGRTGVNVRDTLTSGLDELKGKVRQAAQEAALAMAAVVQARAIELCPISPGKGHGADGSHMVEHIDVQLQDSSGSTISARVGVFRTDIINYAPHVEFGPNKRPFLRPAIDETRQEAHDVGRRVFLQSLTGVVEFKTAVRFRGIA